MTGAFGNRKATTIAKALFQVRHYRAAAAMLVMYKQPLSAAPRYLFASGHYPAKVPIRTPLGVVEPTLYSHDDMLTVNEIFCRGDYRCAPEIRTVVDFGSNIGISALYFLTRNTYSRAYLFEPLPMNLGRLRENLRGFEGRYQLSPMAVSLAGGEADFGCEVTGRYGGIGLVKDTTLRVPCISAVEVLKGVLGRHGEIDVLKIDVESLDREILLSIPPEILRRIKNIFIEVEPLFKRNPLPETHDYRRYGCVARFRRRPEWWRAKKLTCIPVLSYMSLGRASSPPMRCPRDQNRHFLHPCFCCLPSL
jgi:FkbM family methyltransferase